MKSRQEFTNETEYKQYLKYYFAGQAMTKFINMENMFNIVSITQNAVETANQLIIRLEADDKEQRDYKPEEEPIEEIPPIPE